MTPDRWTPRPWEEYRAQVVAALRSATNPQPGDGDLAGGWDPKAYVVAWWRGEHARIQHDRDIAGSARIGQTAALADALYQVLTELDDQEPAGDPGDAP